MKRSKKSPLLGYNNNVTFQGKVYHVQTEDSGVEKPHIITHLFTEGIILATRKSSYAHLVDDPDLEEKVKKMMRDQHKEMFIALRDGTYQQFSAAAAQPAKGPVTVRGMSGSVQAGPAPEPVVRRSLSRSTAAGVPAQKGGRRSVPPPAAPGRRKSMPPPSATRTRPPSSLAEQPSPSASGGRILPSRPSRAPEIVGNVPSPPPPVKRPQKSIFSDDQPEKSGFGQDLISERSLDEVIMGFLAEELEDE